MNRSLVRSALHNPISGRDHEILIRGINSPLRRLLSRRGQPDSNSALSLLNEDTPRVPPPPIDRIHIE